MRLRGLAGTGIGRYRSCSAIGAGGNRGRVRRIRDVGRPGHVWPGPQWPGSCGALWGIRATIGRLRAVPARTTIRVTLIAWAAPEVAAWKKIDATAADPI